MRRDIEKAVSRRAFVNKLRRLAEALERGERFAIQIAGRRVAVPRDAAFGIEHEREGDVEEIEFQMTWKTARRRKRRARPGPPGNTRGNDRHRFQRF